MKGSQMRKNTILNEMMSLNQSFKVRAKSIILLLVLFSISKSLIVPIAEQYPKHKINKSKVQILKVWW